MFENRLPALSMCRGQVSIVNSAKLISRDKSWMIQIKCSPRVRDLLTMPSGRNTLLTLANMLDHFDQGSVGRLEHATDLVVATSTGCASPYNCFQSVEIRATQSPPILQDQVEKLLHENECLKKENAELKKENAELKKENAELKKENGELKKENAELREQVRMLLRRVDDLEHIVMAQQKEMEELRNLCKAQQKEMEDLRNLCKAQQNEIEDVRSRKCPHCNK